MADFKRRGLWPAIMAFMVVAAFGAYQALALDVTDYGAVANDGLDDSAAVQAAIDNGGPVTFGNATSGDQTWQFNVVLKNKVIVRGNGKSTVCIPNSNYPVFRALSSTPVTGIAIRDLKIDGTATKATYTAQDGISLVSKGAGNYVDGADIDNVTINACGRYGIRAVGTASAGPFVQDIRLERLDVLNCADSGLYFDGLIVEGVAENCMIYKNGDATHPNIVFASPDTSTSVRRFTFIGGSLNGNASVTGDTVIRAVNAQNVGFIGVNFEAAAKFMIYSGTTTRNITVDRCRIAATEAVDKAILVYDCDQMQVENNQFTTSPLTTQFNYGVYLNSPVSRIKGFSAENNVYFPTNMTAPVYYASPTNTIASDAVRAYGYSLVLDTQGALSTDDLTNIYDENGTSNRIPDGKRIVIRITNAARSVKVKSTGNIAVHNTRVLNATSDTLALQWDAALAKWVETGYYGAGDGTVSVDEDFGSDDALLALVDGVATGGVSIKAFTKTDYDAGNRGDSYVIASTYSNSDGTWVTNMMLSSGVAHTLLYTFGADSTTTEITP